ncbi:hypothetical protein A3F66_00030 [candidate division TM6 bacterium RIFCSPHIGHO2_12_FULL_32_22]|nr:MAG: hypothetical protein A3F66_00030 [candidate division TM6 bacterium RIFCSPHIGHO2_12_FULL_32_22]
MLLTEILEDSIKKHPNKVALIMKMGYRTHTFTYAQIYELAYKTALFLVDNGIGKNDKVVICAPNSPYWIIIFWACLLIGAIPIPVNIQNTSEQIQKIIDQTEAKILFKNLFFKSNLKHIKEFLIEYLEDLVDGYDPRNLKKANISEDDLVEILYTSGTTGNPKGVMLSHKNISSNLQELIKLINVNLENDRMLSILPLSHIFEQTIGYLLPYSQGVEIIYTHSHAAIGQLMQKYKITKMIAVPEFLQVFTARIEGAIESSHLKFLFKFLSKISSKINNIKFSRIIFYPFLKKMGKLDTVACGGAYLDPNLEKKWDNLGIRILQGYGLTETSPAVSTNTFDVHKLGSSGKIVPNVQIKIEADKEILVKGPNVFKGYYRDEKHTKDVFTNDGYFETGDMGELDNEGFLFIHGRKKYMILSSGGQNVYPEDIEMELNKIKGVQDSCVIGVKKPNGQEEIHASILLKPDIKINVEEIIKEANSHLASYQKITGWSVWPELDFPRTVTRKIKKNDVIEWLQSQKTTSKPDHEAKKNQLTMILSYISAVPENRILDNTRLVEDLHLDSLMRVELTLWIDQELGTAISESDIQPGTTVKDLELIIESKRNIKQKPELKNWPRYKIIKMLRAILQPVVLAIARIFVNLKVEGLENLEDLRLPLFFMPNHTSYIDGLVVEMAIPKRIRKNLSFAAARDVLYQEYWYISWLLEFLFNSFAIQRGANENIKSGLESIGTMLDKNYSVVLFPEGRMSKDGHLLELKGGAGLLAVEMKVQVVPMLLIGTRDVLPYDAVRPRKFRGNVTVKFGKPLKFKRTDSYEFANKKIYEALKELENIKKRNFMFSKRDVVVFFAGAEAFHALSHVMLSFSGILPISMFGITLTPHFNLVMIIINAVITAGLILLAYKLDNK